MARKGLVLATSVVLAAAVAFGAAPFATQASPEEAYEVSPIVVPEGWTEVEVFDLNETDVMAGHGRRPDGHFQAFLATTTGSTPLPIPEGYTDSWGVGGLNDANQVAGYAKSVSGDFDAFIFELGDSTPIPHPPIPNDDWGDTYCYDINEAGQAACWGRWYVAWRPFIGMASGSQLIPLPGQFGWGFLRGLNDASEVAGLGYDSGSGNGVGGIRSDRAFGGDASGTTAVPWLDDWAKTISEDINNSGVLIGTAETYSGDQKAFVWDGGIPTVIPAVGGWSSMDVGRFGINESGVVVGHACCVSAAWIWDADRGTRTLGSMVPSEWRLGDVPRGINGGGHILIKAYNYDTAYYGPVILVPVDPPPNSPPIADADGPYEVDEGSVVAFDGTGSTDPDGDALEFAWDLDDDGTFEVSGVSPEVTFRDGPGDSGTVTLLVTDPYGLSDMAATTVTVHNVPPEVGSITVDASLVEVGSKVTVQAEITDPGVLDTHTALWEWGDGTSDLGTVIGISGSITTFSDHAYTVPGIYPIDLTVTDNDGDSGHAAFEFVVVYDPSAGFVTGGGWIDSPAGAYRPAGLPFDGSFYKLVRIPTSWSDARIAAAASSAEACDSAHLATFTSAAEQEILAALMADSDLNGWIGGHQPTDALVRDEGWRWITDETWDYTAWAEGEPNDTPFGTYIPGSEQHLETLIGDGAWNDAPDFEEKYYVVEYEGCDMGPTGKATFGLVSKYRKGATTPTGHTQFQFKAGDLSFSSTSYDWLVVTGSNRAQFKGVGTLNGEGGYKFMLWAGDGDPDTFRIKIWSDDESGSETVIYDNGPGQSVTAGNIVVNAKK
jgi:probable HAF family extracellular repeat protein